MNGEFGMLGSHVPRANPVWRALDGNLEAVVVFQGPESYVTPSWYPSKQAHGKVAPTWNFVVAHARGNPRAIDDADWLLRHLNELTDDTNRIERSLGRYPTRLWTTETT
jgi:transcriptional regulator